jgi:alkylhydroperoxidase family enzyme
LTPEQILAARRGDSTDPKTQAALDLTFNILERRGSVSDAQLSDARQAGLSEAEIVEVVGTVTVMIMTNFLNNVAQTAIDFPKVSLEV